MAALEPADHERYMRRCIEVARRAADTHDTPVGALIVRGDRIIAEAAEAVRARRDVTAHAEIEAVRQATALAESLDLSGCTLYTTVEPCVMCAWALRLARVGIVVTGTAPAGTAPALNGCTVLADPGILPNRPPPLLIRGVLAAECLALLE